MKPHERIRQIRLKKGLKQVYVAEKLGLSAALYNAIEMGRRPLRAELIPQLAEVLEVEPCHFFDPNLNPNRSEDHGTTNSTV